MKFEAVRVTAPGKFAINLSILCCALLLTACLVKEEMKVPNSFSNPNP